MNPLWGTPWGIPPAAIEAKAAAPLPDLRRIYYPKQRAFFTGSSKRKATRKTRRAGATAGGCREFLMRACEIAGWRGTYVTTTRIEAKARAWRSDTQSGLVDLIERYGTKLDRPGVPAYQLGGVVVDVREGELALVFDNGSRIDLFGANEEANLGKQRGLAKHVYWIDEAQDFRWLERFYKAVIVGAMVDFDGECWLSGTPGRDCVGMFFTITDEDAPVDEDAAALRAGWEVHAIAVVDNPFFGDDAAARWERTAGKALRDNRWTEEDPDFQREWLAKWVKTDARFVYAANSVPVHELCYAPQRLQPDGFPDLRAALCDLPAYETKREYFLALGADLGTRDAFAFVVWAWSSKDPILYELASWKLAGLDYDEMATFLLAVEAQAHCGLVTADAGGGGKPAVMGWSKKWAHRYGIPILEATKQNKQVAIKQLNNDIRHRHIQLRSGSPLFVEWRTHRWAPRRSSTGALVEDETENHCSDAGLYAHRESFHYRWRADDVLPPSGSVAAARREIAEIEEEMDA